MANKSEIKVNSLDFDQIKQNLIDYYRSDPTFSDYDFEGSGLNIMLDILANNSHLNGVVANMSANDMFLDSAQLRQSVVSHAKLIAYTPRSVRSANAVIDVNFKDVLGAPPYLTMPAGSRIGTEHSYIFSTKEDLLVYPKFNGAEGEYELTDIDIYEGFLNTFTYNINWSDTDQRFIIPSELADMTTLVVEVIEGTVVTTYHINEDLNLLTPEDKVYFLHQNPDDRYEIVFGDSILGYKPIDGATLKVSYVIASGNEDANNIETFRKLQNVDGYPFTITTKVKSFGGAPQETIENIRFTAPKMYKAQNRAVAVEDYENFMLKDYPFIESMSVWGGEYNDPPTYGKVFFSIKPSHTDFLSDNLKAKIKEELIKKYNIVTVIPEIIDPDYIYVNVKTKADYDSKITTRTENDIVADIHANVITHFEETVETFNAPLYFSKLVLDIDDSCMAIAGSLTELTLSKRFYPMVGAEEHRVLKFSNPIVPGTVVSSYYNQRGIVGVRAKSKIIDDSKGNLEVRNTYTGEILYANVGFVDYETGNMTLTIKPWELPDDTKDIRVYATPVEKNIVQGYNQIILVDRSAEKEEVGRLSGIGVKVYPKNQDYK